MMKQSKNLLKIFQNTKLSEALSTTVPNSSTSHESSHWKDKPESHWKDYLFPPAYTAPPLGKNSDRVTFSTSFPHGSPAPQSHWKDYLFPQLAPPAPVKDAGRVKPEFTPEVTEKETICIIQSPTQDDINKLPNSISPASNAPIALVFGWAGSKHKNLDKYSSLYRRAGFTTIQYILPTRHIFRDTSQIPEIMDQVYSHLSSPFLSLSSRPIFLHCMSDTGVMCYQGLQAVLDKHGAQLDIKGVVWDSCPGPRPEMTAPRVAALIAVNMFCCLRDGLGYGGSIVNTYNLLKDRAVPGYLARRRGQEFSMNLIDGVWCGYFARDLPSPGPELFLYSKADFYLPWTYLEENVLKNRKGDVRTMRWDKSRHVDHLRKYKQEYTNVLLDFVHTKYETRSMEAKEDKKEDKEEELRIAKQGRKKRQERKNRDEEVNNRIRTSSFS